MTLFAVFFIYFCKLLSVERESIRSNDKQYYTYAMLATVSFDIFVKGNENSRDILTARWQQQQQLQSTAANAASTFLFY